MSESWLVQHPLFLIWLSGALAYEAWFLVRDVAQGLTASGRAQRDEELEWAQEHATPLDMNRPIMVALMALTALAWPFDLLARLVASVKDRWWS